MEGNSGCYEEGEMDWVNKNYVTSNSRKVQQASTAEQSRRVWRIAHKSHWQDDRRLGEGKVMEAG